MAPAQKRGAAQTVAAKKQRVDPTMKAVMDGLRMSTEASEASKNMLVAALPNVIGMATNERHACQDAVIKMIDDVLAGVEAKLTAASAEEVAKVQVFEDKQKTLEAALEEAQTVFTTAEEMTGAKLVALKETQGKAKEAHSTLSEKQDLQKAGDEDFERVTNKKKEIDIGIGEHFAAIDAGVVEDLKSHFKALQPLLAELPLEDSLKGALQSSCAKNKADRGGFDAMVLQQLETQLKERAAKVEADLQELTPAATVRAQEVVAAQVAADAATAAQETAAEELATAKESQATAKEAVRVAKEVLATYQPEYKEATTARDEKAMEIDNFKVHTMGCYGILKGCTPQANTGGA